MMSAVFARYLLARSDHAVDGLGGEVRAGLLVGIGRW